MSKSADKKKPAVDMDVFDMDAFEVGNVTPPPLSLYTEMLARSAQDKKGKEGERQYSDRIKFIQLFEFADKWDIIMTVLSVLAALGSGVIFPVFLLSMGDVVDGMGSGMSMDFKEISAEQLFFMLNMSGTPLEALYALFNLTPGTNISLLPAEDQAGIKNMIIKMIYKEMQNSVNPILYKMLYYGAISAVLTLIHSLFSSLSATRQGDTIRKTFFRRAVAQEMGWFDSQQTGALTANLTDIQHIQDGLGQRIPMFFVTIANFIGGFIVAFVKGWKMALVVLCVTPILMIATGIIAMNLRVLFTQTIAITSKVGEVAEEYLANEKTVVALGLEKVCLERYNEHLNRLHKVGRKRTWAFASMFAIIFFILFCSFSLAFWYGSRLILDEEMSAGGVMIVFMGIMMGAMSLSQIAPSITTFTNACGAAYEVYGTIHRESLIDAEKNAQDDTIDHNFVVKGDIDFSGICFRYPTRPEVQVLRNFDLHIDPGTTVALVGPSGCGKSTIVGLLERFYDCEDGFGTVKIDGVPIEKIGITCLRKQIGIVTQEPILFATTIAQNIAWGAAKGDGSIGDGPECSATQEEIERVAKLANAHDFIMNLTDGYNTVVGQRGTQLSGGQKQRIAIARALIRNPKILIFDEATSALDSKSEADVQEAIDQVAHMCTCVIIAHRLSTVRNATKICSIKDGRVFEQGTHEELMAIEGGLYRSLVERQAIAQNRHNERKARREETRRKLYVKRIEEKKKQKEEEKEKKKKEKEEEKKKKKKDDDSDSDEDVSDSESIPEQSDSEEDTPDDVSPESSPSPSPSPAGSSLSPGRSPSPTSTMKAAKSGKNEGRMGEMSLEEQEKLQGELKKHRTRMLFRAFGVLKPYAWLVVIGCFGALCSGAVMPVFALFMAEMVGVLMKVPGVSCTSSEYEEDISFWACMFIVIACINLFAAYMQFGFLGLAAENMQHYLRYEYFKAMLRQEPGWFDDRSNMTGILTTRLATDARLIYSLTGTQVSVIIQAASSFFAGIVVGFIGYWKIALVVLATVPVILFTTFYQMRSMMTYATKLKKAYEEAGRIASEGLENVRTVVSICREQTFLEEFGQQLEKPEALGRRTDIIRSVLAAVQNLYTMWVGALAFWYGIKIIVDGDDVDFVKIMKAQQGIMFGAQSVGQVSAFFPDYSKSVEAAYHLFNLYDRKPDVINSRITDATESANIHFEDIYKIDVERSKQPPKDKSRPTRIIEDFKGDIEFKDVSFSYPIRPDVTVLRGLSFHAEPRKTVALVGESGCGKSTSIGIIERLYKPTGGKVLLDGVPIEELDIDWLRSQIGLVSQEPVLFAGTIYDNIRFGKTDATQEEIEEAAKMANAHNFISAFPKGYDTEVGEKGVTLSGGQKQRIAIARALVRHPKILLLDEATSALDTESEKIVQEALDRAANGRTTISIAHRLSTIRDADKIVVVSDGVCDSEGTHEELMALNGIYAQLAQAQSGVVL